MKNHYGIPVDENIPVTGVWHMNDIDYIDDDIWYGDAIDPDYLALLEEYGDDIPEDMLYYEQSEALIGYNYMAVHDCIQYDIDPKAEYSAIASFGQFSSFPCLQVVNSKWGIKCALCSPCYPGQGDCSTPGDFIAYAPPPDLFDDDNPIKQKIFKLEDVND